MPKAPWPAYEFFTDMPDVRVIADPTKLVRACEWLRDELPKIEARYDELRSKAAQINAALAEAGFPAARE